MANSLGNAAHAVDGDIAQLQTDLATYLGAGGSAALFASKLRQMMLNADSTYQAALNAAFLKALPPRPSPAAVAGTLASITPGAVYP